MAVVAGPRTGTTTASLMMTDAQEAEGRIPLVTHVITDDDLGLVQVRRQHVIHVQRAD